MVSDKLIRTSPYRGQCIILPTKHAKGAAIAPPFDVILGAGVLEYNLDTDLFGTFSGEIERRHSAAETVKQKCEAALDVLRADLALASEGSFGPHPFIPFAACDTELIYFVDRRCGFRLQMSYTTLETNYLTRSIENISELNAFADTANFPSHALIVRPHQWNDRSVIFKGIQNTDELIEAFKVSMKSSGDGKVWVETDMRAHLNPTRMDVIAKLATAMAERLATPCPACDMPGWGRVRTVAGMECKLCGQPTQMIKSEIFGCAECDHEEIKPREDGLVAADPANCNICNP